MRRPRKRIQAWLKKRQAALKLYWGMWLEGGVVEHRYRTMCFLAALEDACLIIERKRAKRLPRNRQPSSAALVDHFVSVAQVKVARGEWP